MLNRHQQIPKIHIFLCGLIVFFAFGIYVDSPNSVAAQLSAFTFTNSSNTQNVSFHASIMPRVSQEELIDCDEMQLQEIETTYVDQVQRQAHGQPTLSQGEFESLRQYFADLIEICSRESNIVTRFDPIGANSETEISSDFVVWLTKWGQGSPMTTPHTPSAGGTVTYSFMPDGVSLYNPLDAIDMTAGSNVAIGSFPTFQECFFDEIRNAFRAWESVANIDFVEVADSGVEFGIESPNVQGNIRVGGHSIDGFVLAHAYYPPPFQGMVSAYGDIHFDIAQDWVCNSPAIGQKDIGFTALHEIGHAIGLDHSPFLNAVMYEWYLSSFSQLTPDDIEGARAIYGDRYDCAVGQPVLQRTVSSLGDSGEGSLRQALTDLDSNSCDVRILFTTTGVINLQSPLPNISTNMMFFPPANGEITIQRYSGGNYRIFNILSGKTVIIDGLTLSNGRTPDSESSGGAISNQGNLTLTNVTIRNSSAINGGGIANFGFLEVRNSAILGNRADFLGGGIYNYRGGAANVINSTIGGNSAQEGGGIYNEDTAIASIANSTLRANSANIGGGVYGNGVVTLKNSILTESAGGDCHLAPNGIIDAFYSLVQSGLGCVNNTNVGNITGTPMLGTLTGNPGYYPLLLGSLGIDAGDNSLIPIGITTDQAGHARVYNSTVDMGAIEYGFDVSDPTCDPLAAIISIPIERIPRWYTLGADGNAFESFGLSNNGNYLVFKADNGDESEGLYLYNRHNCERTLISHSEVFGRNAGGYTAAISSDGRYVTFDTAANMLFSLNPYIIWTGYGTVTKEVYRADTLTGNLLPISISLEVGDDGIPLGGNGMDYSSSVSSDGRYVAFESSSSNLGFNTTEAQQISVRDTRGQIILASSSLTGEAGNGESRMPSISPDGRYVAFVSRASNFVTNDTDDQNVFLKNVATNDIILIPLPEGAVSVSSPDVSANGAYVTFSALLASEQWREGVFLYERATDQLTRVSLRVHEDAIYYSVFANPVISDDGRYIAYASEYYDPYYSSYARIWIYDRITGDQRIVTPQDAGLDGLGYNHYGQMMVPAISGDGQYVAFLSAMNDFVPGDIGNDLDLFLIRWQDVPYTTPELPVTPSPTPTETFTFTPSATPTSTFTPSVTPSSTSSYTPTQTFTASNTPTPSDTPSSTPTFTASSTASPTPTATASSTYTPTPTATETGILVANPISPIGLITGTQPTFTWTSVQNPYAWYYLWISGPGGYVLDQWYDGWNICGEFECSVTPSLSLPGGSYSWWIQSWTPTGSYSVWSTETLFTVDVPIAVAVPVSPMGTTTETQPTFTWQGTVGAAWYNLWVTGPTGAVVNQWYDGAGLCSSGICSVQPSLNLIGGTYRWWVQMWTPLGGYAPWSAEAQFVVALPPTAPALIAPTGTISASQPAFQWTNVPAVAWFYLWISNDSGHVLDQWFNAYSICNHQLCELAAPITLPNGNYHWWVQGWSVEGSYGAWSSQGDFSINVTPTSAEATPEDTGIGVETPSVQIDPAITPTPTEIVIPEVTPTPIPIVLSKLNIRSQTRSSMHDADRFRTIQG